MRRTPPSRASIHWLISILLSTASGTRPAADTTSPRRWSIPIAPVSKHFSRPGRSQMQFSSHDIFVQTSSMRVRYRIPSSSFFFGLNGLGIHQAVLGSCAEGGGRRKKSELIETGIAKRRDGWEIKDVFYWFCQIPTHHRLFFFLCAMLSSSYLLVDQLSLFFFPPFTINVHIQNNQPLHS